MTLVASVVVPYFEDQRRLDLVLVALELQTLGPDAFEVVIADDGSATPPDLGARPFVVRLVRQDDLGVRPGAARNLGARVATGATLVFLDGDTVPEPDYLRAIVAACGGQRLATGRRRHADLSACAPADVHAWLDGDGPAPEVLPEPAWLDRGLEATRGLRDADARSYRFVIAAVMACPRDAFLGIGGFAEEIDVYGGEDWELARRWWLAGRDLVHAPDAVAWHDGPDLAGRDDALALKNAETLRIAGLITDPHLRGRGLLWPYPRVVVRCGFVAEPPAAALVACLEALLAFGDVGVWIGTTPAPPLADPRVHAGMPGADVLGRCEAVVDLRAPVAADAPTLATWLDAAPARGDVVTVRSPRDVARGTPLAELPPVEVVPVDVALEQWLDRRARD